jgi:7-carboxy-7-deazaguanine synthase
MGEHHPRFKKSEIPLKNTARVSEYFCSFQGEGPWMGTKQFFIRFCGCNCSCRYCDTRSSKGYKIYTVEQLIGIVLDEQMKHHFKEISLTGGEPLLQARFVGLFLKGLLKRKHLSVYLETNSTLPASLGIVHAFVDKVSADFKLVSAGADKDCFKAHSAFFTRLSGYKMNFFIKCIVNEMTSGEEFSRMCRLIRPHLKNRLLVLQPEMKRREPCISWKKLHFLYSLAETHKIKVRIIPQIHKILNFR